jgi:hypothetical protein
VTDPIQRNLRNLVVGTALAASLAVSMPQPVKADTTSTLLIAAGAAAVVGALLIDSNNRPYYVNNNRRYYVTQNEATYYRAHHRTVQRQAWVPENEYPVQRSAGYQFPQQRAGRGNNSHGAQGHGNQGGNRDQR